MCTSKSARRKNAHNGRREQQKKRAAGQGWPTLTPKTSHVRLLSFLGCFCSVRFLSFHSPQMAAARLGAQTTAASTSRTSTALPRRAGIPGIPGATSSSTAPLAAPPHRRASLTRRALAPVQAVFGGITLPFMGVSAEEREARKDKVWRRERELVFARSHRGWPRPFSLLSWPSSPSSPSHPSRQPCISAPRPHRPARSGYCRERR